mgnify:CR=1 FL=1
MQDLIRKRVVIAGFGPHAIRTATTLLHRGLCSLDDMVIVDPSSEPVARLQDYFRDCGTSFLRSGPFEHVHPEDEDLRTFCKGRTNAFARGERPCVNAWLDHAQSVAKRFALKEVHTRGWVTWFDRTEHGPVVKTTAGTFQAEKLVLATGQATPYYPEWSARLRGHNPLVCSIFDNDFEGADLPAGEDAIVLGSGITAGQLVDVLENKGQRKITLLTRRPLSKGEGKTSSMHWREADLRKKLCGYSELKDRDAMLRAEGDRGTMPIWEMERIEQLQSQGRVEHLLGEVAHVVPGKNSVEVILDTGRVLKTSLLALATGFVSELQDWMVRAARKAELPFYPDGLPRLDSNFHWGGGIFLTGRQAVRVGGPFAHNIVGGMIFADEFCNSWK